LLELTRASSAAAPRANANTGRWTAALAAQLVTTMFATRRSTPIAIELAVGVQVVSFEIAINALAARACGSTSGRGLDHHQWGFVLLRNLRRRQPGLLQRGVLAEQRFLQRPSHTLSLRSVKFPGPFGSTWQAAARTAGTARRIDLVIRPAWQSCNVTRSPEPRAT
jgi:hypothetical protein